MEQRHGRTVCPYSGGRGRRNKSKPYAYVHGEEGVLLRIVAMKGPCLPYYVVEVSRDGNFNFAGYADETFYETMLNECTMSELRGSTASEYSKRASKGIDGG